MENKNFTRGLLIRAIPFVILLVAAIVLKLATNIEGDWWGWYVIYALVVVAMAFVIVYAVKNGRSILIGSVRRGIEKKAAQHFFDEWDKPGFNLQNVVGFVYQNEREFDRTILFGEEKMVVEQLMRDDDGMVTGDKITQECAYGSIKELEVVDIGGEGCIHVEITFSNDVQEYAYFDVDLAKFLMEKSKKQLVGVEKLRAYYYSVINR